MTIFDLLFLAAFLASVITLIIAAVFSIRGRNEQAMRTLGHWLLCAAAYLTVSAVVAYAEPQRILNVGDPWCFDDWCLTAEKVTHTADSYEVGMRIFSTARRVAQRAKGAWIYVIDEQGRRFPPEARADDVPLDVLLQPSESVEASRIFRIPADTHRLGLITGHGGPYCGAMSLLIIGGAGCLFNKPVMIRIE